MKRSFLLALCLSAAAAFAGAYDIGDFTARDQISTDNYATNLSTATIDDATSVPAGNIVLRQKFAQESGLNAYQLYMGNANDISSMTALSIPTGMSYREVVKSKLYKRRGTMPGDDIEKVYFDGKYVYIPGLSSAVAYVNGAPVDLTGEEKTSAKSATAPKQDCDEFDVSCDEDIIAAKNNKDIDVTGNLSNTNSRADARDYSASAAAQDVKDRFGIADEVRFWSAVALSAVAAGSAVVGVLQHMKSSDANRAYKDLENVANTVEGKIKEVCSSMANADECVKWYKATDLDGKPEGSGKPQAFMITGWTYADLQNRMKVNKDTKDSYAMGRNIWFGVSALSLTTAIVLFAW